MSLGNMNEGQKTYSGSALFRVPLAEIRKAVEDLGYTDCQWIDEPMAAQWRDSKKNQLK